MIVLTANAMWLGLRAKSGTTTCSSASDCDGKLIHHLPGETSASDDDIESDFVDGGWIDATMSVNTAGGANMCLMMTNTFTIQTTQCNGSKKYYCKIPCEGMYVYMLTCYSDLVHH